MLTAATKANWTAELEYEIAGMLNGASWDPTDDGDAECIDVVQALVNDWCKAAAA